MAYLRLIDEQEATGDLRREYDAAVERAGRVMKHPQGDEPAARRLAALPCPQPRAQLRAVRARPGDRELLAIAVSAENGARYSLRAHTELLREEGEPEELDARRKALTEFAVKLTRSPAKMGSGDIEALRGRGLSDAAISDAIQEVAFFNYVNRVVTAVGVDDEPDWVD